MANTRPIALWGTQVPPGDRLTPLAAEIPATIRITMAAIDPTAEPEGHGPKRATLKIIRSIGMDDYKDSDDENDSSNEKGEDSEDSEDPQESESESESEDERSTQKKKGEKGPDKEGEKMGVDNKSLKVKKEDSNSRGAKDEDSDHEDEDKDFETEEFVVCTLDAEKNFQQPLDIAIGEEEIVYFKVVGAYDIYLTGNYVHYQQSQEDDYDQDSEDDLYDLSPSDDDMDVYDEESDELDDSDNPPRIQELPSEDEETQEARPITKKDKKAAAAKVEEQKKVKAENKKRPAEDDKASSGEKLSKKQQKKLKNNEGKPVEVGKEPESSPSKTDKKVKFAKEVEQNVGKPKQSKPEEKSGKGSGLKKVNGVTIDDRTIGTGPQAKKGDKVMMRYIGKLSDGKIFDSNTKGKPFSFTIGKGEVIKGWDFGIVGMQRGGERRLIIPPELAYGKKAMPGIPANSALTFDVKLLEIK